MKRRLFTTIAAATLAFGAAPAFAQSDTYISLSGGGVFQQNSDNVGSFDTDFTTGQGTTIPAGTVLPAGADVTWTSDMGTGYTGAGAIGRRYGPLRAELEVAYQSAPISEHTGVAVGGGAIGGEDAGVLITGSPALGVTVADLVADGQGDLQTVYLMVNAYYDLDTGTPLKPYIGGGAGVGFVDVDYNPSATTIIADNDTQFAWQGMAGVAYEVTPSAEAFVGFRYRGTSNPTVTAELFPATFEIENRGAIVEGGFRVSF